MTQRIFDEYIKERVYIERIDVIGPMDEGETVLKALWAEGYRTIRSGPYTNRDMHPNVDMTRFLFIAEREIESPK